ncbi:hypothetical protein HYC85_014838 [Camellia sinensis]|uniref:NADH dehydrogenase [ubiquinone] 1 alpha subcomplex subunit 12 n=1 Tax=Camellia sinensis TaxID=4442 RepID=A0A7J7H9E1_CAMSI|nr:hypothetical protein HYC85_014838 [Camellia sinensis]
MSKLWTKIAGLFRNRSLAGMDKAGNRYFTRKDAIDGFMKEKRWVVFKGEEDPTSIPVEWICWLNGQRKKAPTLEEMMELEARRERVKLNVAFLKKEEEERRAKEGSSHIVTARTGKVGGPDLKSFIQQFPDASEGTTFLQTKSDPSTRTGRTMQPLAHSENHLPTTSMNMLFGLRKQLQHEVENESWRDICCNEWHEIFRANRIWSVLQTRNMATANMIIITF